MYGVPEKDDLVGLVGKELIQICIGVNQVFLQFEKNVRINVESRIEYPTFGGEVGNFCCENAFLIGLLGSTVSEVYRADNRTLGITFSNGNSVELKDDSDQYESFQIKIGDDLIVV